MKLGETDSSIHAEETVIIQTSDSGSAREQNHDEKVYGATTPTEDSATILHSLEDSSGEEEEDDGAHHVSGVPLILLAFGLCVTTFLIGLDQMILATAIPKITTLFNSLGDVGWYGSAYLLTTTSLQPSFGKIYTYFNIKWTFIIALVIFEVGSIICAIAPSSKILILGRAIAGSGAAGLFSGGMTIIAFAIPLRRRPLYIGALGSMFGLSSIVGPILGGVFTDKLTWRWCFWINLPFGAVAILAVFFFFKNPNRKVAKVSLGDKIKDMDIYGAVILVGAIVSLLLALQWGGLELPWSSPKVYGCFIAAGLLGVIFICIQLRLGDRATIPPRILRQRTMTATALTLAFSSMGMFTHIYFLPFYFQAVKGKTAQQSGTAIVPYLIANTLGTIIVGGIVTGVGYYTPFIIFASILFAIGSGLIYTIQVNTSTPRLIGYQILAGAGSGIGIQLPLIAVQVVLSAKDIATGNGIAIFFNSLGGAIALSIGSNIFSSTLVKEISRFAPGVQPDQITKAGSTGLALLNLTPKLLDGVKEAYDKALTTAFMLPIVVAVLCFLSSLVFEWRSVKGKKLSMGPSG